MTHTQKISAALAGLAVAAAPAAAEEDTINYDESKVPAYTLPDPLVMQDGRQVATAAMWRSERRPELLTLFRTHVYGRRLPTPRQLRFHVVESMPDYLHGKGKRKDVRVESPSPKGPVQLLKFTMFVPTQAKRSVPAFVGVLLFDAGSNDPSPGNAIGPAR